MGRLKLLLFGLVAVSVQSRSDDGLRPMDDRQSFSLIRRASAMQHKPAHNSFVAFLQRLHCEAQRSAENAYRSLEAALAADIRSVFQRGVEKAERSSIRQLSMHPY